MEVNPSMSTSARLNTQPATESQTDEVRNIHEKGKELFNFHFQGLIFVSPIEFPL